MPASIVVATVIAAAGVLAASGVLAVLVDRQAGQRDWATYRQRDRKRERWT